MAFAAAFTLLLSGATSASAQGQPRDKQADATEGPRATLLDVMDFAADSREALKEIKDYKAVFTKTELVGNRMLKQVMDIKLREKPFSVYFRYRSGPEAGREVIYVAGANRGNLLVHEVGIKAIAGTLTLPPDGREAMEENRYPITRVGISNMLETAYQIWETERKHSDPAAVDIKFFPNAKLGNSACKAVQITHLQPQRELKFHLSRVYFDKETKLPVRAERYGWPRRQGDKPPLIEEYTYSNIQTNVGLTNADFDSRNPNYGFPR
jgi:outer membrane lipoprotein-sorting protein